MSITNRPVQYKGDDLNAERGPGLGCFRFQLIVLAIFIVLTPLSVTWKWPEAVSAALLFAVVILLLVTGQTIIFLLRLVAADRRSRRRPLGSATKTVGELEDASRTTADDEPPASANDEPLPSADDEPPASANDEPLATADEVAAATPPATPPSGDPGIDEPPPSDEGPVRQ